MGFLRRLFANEPLTPATSGPVFGATIDPGTLYGSMSLDEAINVSLGIGRVSRNEAISVGAIKGSRDRICALGNAPLRLHNAANGKVEPWPFFDGLEPGVAPSITLATFLDDLLFYERAWFSVTHLGHTNHPAAGLRLDPSTVSVQPKIQTIRHATGTGSAQVWEPDPSLIRIDSPNDGLLGNAGARAIRTLGLLERAALNAADGLPPMDYFTASEGADPFVDDEHGTAEEHATRFLDAWAAARRARATGYIPPGVEYHSNTFSPKDLQLVEAREMAMAEIARITGVDAEDLALPTSSRTYFNAQDRRRAFLDFTVGPYLRAIESRFSMDDVTPPGYIARFDLDDFLSADDLTAAQIDTMLVDAEILQRDEARAHRNLEALGPTSRPQPAAQEHADA